MHRTSREPVGGRHARGMVHGRFQPFHRGHAEYIARAAARCEHLTVGITNAEPADAVPEAADGHRHLADANPFTYAEREAFVRVGCRELGVEVAIVPFPISHPDRWHSYVLPGTVHLIRVFDAWGEAKVTRLRAGGATVEVVDEGTAKEISGHAVRAALRTGGDLAQLLQPAVVAALDEFDLIPLDR